MIDVLPRPRVYLDTNVFIRAFESPPDEARPIQQLFETLRENRKLSVTSELTLAEVLAPVQRKGALEPHIKRRIYLNLIVWGGFFDLMPVSRSILYDTAELRRVANHKLPDAVHVVTAIQTRCAFFMSNDNDMKQLPRGMQRVLPDESGVAAVMDALRA